MMKTHSVIQEMADDRVDTIGTWRLELAQMGRVIRIALVIALLALAGFAFLQGLVFPLVVAGGLLLLDVFCRYAFRRLDEAAEILQDEDRPLNAFDQECFDVLATRHPVIAERLFPTEGIRRGRDLRALSRSVQS